MSLSDYFDMPEEIDHSPACGWLQKYVFLFEHFEGKKRRFYFNFANQWRAGEFVDVAMDIGEYVSPAVWIPLERMIKTEEWVRVKKTGDKIKLRGVWGVAYGAPHVQYNEGHPVGLKMYWTEFYPLPRKECQDLIREQWRLVEAGKLVARPQLADYVEERNEIVR